MNKFIKDLLIIEIETTGAEVERDPIVQLAGLLLDKDNLLEKGIFNTYVRTSLLEGTLATHAKELGVDFEVIKRSPKAVDALKKFTEFTNEVSATLTLQNDRHLFFLKAMYKKAGLPFPFEYQVFQLWTLEYIASLRIGLKKIPTLQTMLDYYRLPVKNYRNALERARLEAEVLRRIIK